MESFIYQRLDVWKVTKFNLPLLSTKLKDPYLLLDVGAEGCGRLKFNFPHVTLPSVVSVGGKVNSLTFHLPIVPGFSPENFTKYYV